MKRTNVQIANLKIAVTEYLEDEEKYLLDLAKSDCNVATCIVSVNYSMDLYYVFI